MSTIRLIQVCRFPSSPFLTVLILSIFIVASITQAKTDHNKPAASSQNSAVQPQTPKPKNQLKLIHSYIKKWKTTIGHMATDQKKAKEMAQAAWSKFLKPAVHGKPALTSGMVVAQARLIALVAPYLNDQQQKAVRRHLIRMWASNPRHLNRLQPSQVEVLLGAASAVKAGAALQADLLRNAVAGSVQLLLSKKLKSQQTQAWLNLINSAALNNKKLHKLPPKKIKQKLFDVVWQRFMIKNPSSTKVNMSAALSLSVLAKKVSDNQKAAALKAFNDAFLENNKALRQADVKTFQLAMYIASALGGSDQDKLAALGRWGRQVPEINSWDILDLYYVLHLSFSRLKNGMNLQADSFSAVRHKAAQGIARQLARLDDKTLTPTQILARIDVLCWAVAAAEGHKQITDTIIRGAKKSLGQPQVAARILDSPLGRFLIASLARVGDRNFSQRAFAAWIKKGSHWKQISDQNMTRVLAALYPPQSSAASKAQGKLLLFLQKNLDKHPQRLAAILANLPSKAVASKAYSQVIDTFGQSALTTVKNNHKLPVSFFANTASLFSALPEEGKSHHTLAKLISKYFSNGGRIEGEFEDYHKLGTAIKKAKATDTLRSQLITPDGQPRLDVAQTLSWAYSSDPKAVANWRTYLKAQASNKNLPGDVRARWYLALSYTAKLPPVLSAAPGLDWVQKALDVAQSESLRLACLRSMVKACIKLDDFDKASKLLASNKKHFNDQTSLKAIALLEKKITTARANAKQRAASIAAKRYIKRIYGNINHIQKLLAVAKKQSQPQANINSLEETITNLKKHLSSAKKERNRIKHQTSK